MHMSNTTMSPEKTAEKKHKLYYFLFDQLKDEAKGAECYCKKAKLAHEIGDATLSSMLLSHSKDELKHFKDLIGYIEKNIPDLDSNPLYPLLENLEDWAADIEDGIVNFLR